MDLSSTGLGGFKEVIFSVQGRGAYSRLKFESGAHRVQRVPATESGGRIHTSTATVAVLPEAEEVDVEIDEKDIRIDVFCSSGPGGQSVNPPSPRSASPICRRASSSPAKMKIPSSRTGKRR